MKKLLSIILVTVLLVVFVTGCGNKNAQTPGQSSQIRQTEQQTQQSPSQDTADQSAFIGEDRAKEIALERAGLAADDVVFDRIELDRDAGIWQYEVDFRQGTTEYDVDIKADDGTIISFETDLND